jgi:hypothetical protein
VIAPWLEACAYKIKLFKLASLEHTRKKKMIPALKRAEAVNPAE